MIYIFYEASAVYLSYISLFLQAVAKLKKLYSHPDDVDLLVGGMAERPADDSTVGYTFRCIIGEQLARTKKGDRFFYDVPNQQNSFTEGELELD